MIRTQYSRVINKRSDIAGVVPTIGPSNDHTDGTWLDTDIYPGEFYFNMEDQKVWFGWTSGSTSGVTQIYPLPGPGGNITINGGFGIEIQGSSPSFTINFTGLTPQNPTTFLIQAASDFTLIAGGTSNFTPLIADLITPRVVYINYAAVVIDTTTLDAANFEGTCGWYNDGTGWAIVGGGPCVDNQSNIPGSSSIDPAFAFAINTDGSGVLGIELTTPANPNDIKVRLTWEYLNLDA